MNDKTTPATEYGRLLEALEMPAEGSAGSSFLRVAERLGVSPAQTNDCLRRGQINETVLAAASRAGINPDFVKHGRLPHRLT